MDGGKNAKQKPNIQTTLIMNPTKETGFYRLLRELEIFMNSLKGQHPYPVSLSAFYNVNQCNLCLETSLSSLLTGCFICRKTRLKVDIKSKTYFNGRNGLMLITFLAESEIRDII